MCWGGGVIDYVGRFFWDCLSVFGWGFDLRIGVFGEDVEVVGLSDCCVVGCLVVRGGVWWIDILEVGLCSFELVGDVLIFEILNC